MMSPSLLSLVLSLAAPPTGDPTPSEPPTSEAGPEPSPEDSPAPARPDTPPETSPIAPNVVSTGVNASGRPPQPRPSPAEPDPTPSPSAEVVRRALTPGGVDLDIARQLYREREQRMLSMTMGFGVTWGMSVIATGLLAGVRNKRLNAVCTGPESSAVDAVDPCIAQLEKGQRLAVPLALAGTTAAISGIGTLISGIVLGIHQNNRFMVGVPRDSLSSRRVRPRAWARWGTRSRGRT